MEMHDTMQQVCQFFHQQKKSAIVYWRVGWLFLFSMRKMRQVIGLLVLRVSPKIRADGKLGKDLFSKLKQLHVPSSGVYTMLKINAGYSEARHDSTYNLDIASECRRSSEFNMFP
jgi:hypothetical protein